MADRQFVIGGIEATPADWNPPEILEFVPKTAFANYDGSGASAPFLPCLEIISDSGHTVAFCPVGETVPVGGTAIVSWFPGGELESQTASQSGGGGIESLTSPTGSISVTNPGGPVTQADLPASGVTPGVYGDSTHVAKVTVNSEGIVTAVSPVGISGVAGGMANIFDQTLAVATPEIDTGANGVPAGYSGLIVTVIARADPAVFSQGWALRFNNDSGNNYQFSWTDQSGVTLSALFAGPVNGVKVMEGPGANIAAGIFGVAQVFIPGYAATTANKACSALGGFASDSTHSEMVTSLSVWNNTAAITRIALFTGGGNMVAGSRMTIYGLP